MSAWGEWLLCSVKAVIAEHSKAMAAYMEKRNNKKKRKSACKGFAKVLS